MKVDVAHGYLSNAYKTWFIVFNMCTGLTKINLTLNLTSYSKFYKVSWLIMPNLCYVDWLHVNMKHM